MKALVLSGGGSKGSYQIGVWKALKKLNIKYDIITGTSVGALNGALMTQGNYKKALSVWQKINLKVLFGEDAIDSEKISDIYKMYGKNFLEHGGMDVKELESIIESSINKQQFFNSKINYGLVTYNLSQKKAVELEKKDIKEDLLVDYLMASATCYPAFKKKNIEGLKYIDGGFYDNLPINLAIKMGATEIIAVDLRAPGIKKKTKEKVSVTTIKPNNKLTNFLNFYEEGNLRNMSFGYNDTMKVFGKLEGNHYTFKKGHIKKNEKIYQETYEHVITQVLNSKTLGKKFKELLNITSKKKDEIRDTMFLMIMEHTAKSLGLDETKIYGYRQFNYLLKKELKKYLKQKNTKEKVLLKIELDLYQKLKEKNYHELRKKALIYPIELLRAIYLYTICEA